MRLRPNHFFILSTALTGTLALTGCPSDNTNPSPAGGQSLNQSANQGMQTGSNPRSNSPPAIVVPAPRDEIVATVAGVDITRKQLDEPLIKAYGLNMLMKLVELELAKQEADREHLTVSPQDIIDETQRYTELVFKDDKKLSDMRDELDQKVHDNKTAQAEQLRSDIRLEQQRLLKQLLEQQKITQTDFEIAMQTNTYLRRIVQPAVQTQLTDANLQERFKARYGEKVQIRHIAVANLQEVNEAKRRLAEGQSFQQVAQDLSRDRQTAALGGEMPSFSRFAPYPQVFKDLAFSLAKPGDISDPVEVDGSYHLIQLVDRIAPTAVKFEDVKEGVRQDLSDTLTDAAVKQVRAQLGQAAMKELQIENPELARQYQDKVAERDTEIRDRDQIRRQLKLQRPPATAATGAATPSTASGTSAGTAAGTPTGTTTGTTTGATPGTNPGTTTDTAAAAATEPASKATATPASTPSGTTAISPK